ncbi:MAG: hypothetical protein AAF591_18065 [Verrucomicrobiota bacterium]
MELFIIIIPIFIAFAIWSAIQSHKKAQARLAAMRAFATERNLYFHPDKLRGFDAEYPGFDCFRRGQRRYAYNLIAGQLDGFETTMFDYHYVTKSRDSKGRTRTTTHRFSGVLVDPGFPIRPIVVRREGMFDKMKAAFGWDDIDFESAEFSRSYYVSSPDKRWAYDVINGKVIEALLRVKGFSFESDGEYLLCLGQGRVFELAEFEQAFQLVSGFLKAMPEHAKERASQP